MTQNERHTGFWAFSVEWFIPDVSAKSTNRESITESGRVLSSSIRLDANAHKNEAFTETLYMHIGRRMPGA